VDSPSHVPEGPAGVDDGVSSSSRLTFRSRGTAESVQRVCVFQAMNGNATPGYAINSIISALRDNAMPSGL